MKLDEIIKLRLMKKLFLLIFLLVSEYTYADWVQIASSDNRVTYIDLLTVIRKDSLTRIWVLIDHSEIQKEAGDSYLSSKGQWEINCDSISARQIFHVLYPGHMGTGNTIWSGSLKQRVQPIVPGTIGDAVFKAVCR